MGKWHFLMKKNANAFSMRSGSLVRFSLHSYFPFLPLNVHHHHHHYYHQHQEDFLAKGRERKDEERKKLCKRGNVESRWHDDGNGKKMSIP